MPIKIGINGFGRIGKMVFRLAIQDPEIEIVQVNDKMDIELLHHLIKYDSVHGRFFTDVKIENDSIIIHDREILSLIIASPMKFHGREVKLNSLLNRVEFLKQES